jgi:hypothetical protein
MRRNTGAEAASLRERGSGRTGRGEGPRLVDAAEFLRKALRPASSNGRIIVDEYVGAVIDGGQKNALPSDFSSGVTPGGNSAAIAAVSAQYSMTKQSLE